MSLEGVVRRVDDGLVERRVFLLGLFGFGLWTAVVLALIVGGVALALDSSWAADAAGAGAFASGSLLVVALSKMRGSPRWLRVPTGASGAAAGTILSFYLPGGNATGLLWLGLMSGFLGLPLCWYLAEMGLGAARQRQSASVRP
jgi:hypothetical protein